MKYILILLFFVAVKSSYGNWRLSSSKPITITLEYADLPIILIADSLNYNGCGTTLFCDGIDQEIGRMTISKKDIPPKEALDYFHDEIRKLGYKVIQGKKGSVYNRYDRYYVCRPKEQKKERRRITIRGTIVDESGYPLIGVTLAGGCNGEYAISNKEGEFEVEVAVGIPITIMYVGMYTEILYIRSKKDTWHNVTMREYPLSIEEITVIH